MRATVVGGGLAGCEAAWALAERGVEVILREMRPGVTTPAHRTGGYAELVCSNSFKSLDSANAHGLLKAELLLLGSLLLETAMEARVPGGAALLVDRTLFSRLVTEKVNGHPLIHPVPGEVRELAAPAVVATGPLTSPTLALAICSRLGTEALAFYDAISPIVADESLDHSLLYPLSRYGKGEGKDYLNAPLSQEEYSRLVEQLVEAERHRARDFDKTPLFEGCLPIEEMARRGPETLRFGPLKPVGLPDPRTGREPFAVVQLRREDRAGQMWNLVGFQTRLRIGEQRRILRSIPGLGGAEFLRLGSVHRNTFLNSPGTLSGHLSARDDAELLFAGQLVGVEGYTESLATGIVTGITLARLLSGRPPHLPPPQTLLGSLLAYVTGGGAGTFQPMNANFGLLPPLEQRVRPKRKRREMLAERALDSMAEYADSLRS